MQTAFKNGLFSLLLDLATNKIFTPLAGVEMGFPMRVGGHSAKIKKEFLIDTVFNLFSRHGYTISRQSVTPYPGGNGTERRVSND